MNRLGRPKLDPTDRRTVPVKVYLNDEEFARFNREAHALGMGLSAYVRYLLTHSVRKMAA